MLISIDRRHEMRNPLSAMLLCADGIAEALLDFQAAKNKTAILSDALVENNLDAAQTIVLCANHQKRLIDDVLTLSRLNTTMLHVTPVQVQVETTLRGTMKMFDNEFLANGIQDSFEVEESYREAKVDSVFCDPARLVQVFINLLTNVSAFLFLSV
jgi:signal transduction histidine kinase